MLIGIKDTAKHIAIVIVTCCAVFVCFMFLNYNIDIVGIKDSITTPQGMIMYNAQVASGKVVVGISGGCLVITTAVMLAFYIKNYIDSHGKEFGILKALGYSDLSIAGHFWVFGVSVLIGSFLGGLCAYLYMPYFYKMQNNEGLLPQMTPHFHISLALCLIIIPAAFFALMSAAYAFYKLRIPVMSLLKESQKIKLIKKRKAENDAAFLIDLRKNTLRNRKIIVFFIIFSAFCFSAMTQMSISMKDLASESFSWMIISIGLILAFMTILMSLTSVVKANAKTIAMMKVFGYSGRECRRAILGGYRMISYIGFVIGTLYQYLLLKIMVNVVFSDFENIPEYNFNYKALAVSFAAFVVSYELVIYFYSKKIDKQTIKSIMLE